MDICAKIGLQGSVISEKLDGELRDIASDEANAAMDDTSRHEGCLLLRLTAIQCAYLLGRHEVLAALYKGTIANFRAFYGPHCDAKVRPKSLWNVPWNLYTDDLACWSAVMKDEHTQAMLSRFNLDSNEPTEGTEQSQIIVARMLLSLLRKDPEAIARDMKALEGTRTSKSARSKLYGKVIKAVACDGDHDAVVSFLQAWKKKVFRPVAQNHRFSYHATVLCHLYGITIDDPDLSLHIIDVPEAVKARARAAVATLDVKV